MAASERPTHPGRIFDVRFTDFTADPIGSVRNIYRFFDLELTSTAEANMQKWRDDNPERKTRGASILRRRLPVSKPEQIAERFAFDDDYR